MFSVNSDVDLSTMPLVLLHHASSSLKRQLDMLIQLRRFLKNEFGAAAIEYGLLASGISVAIIPSVKDVGVKLVNVFTILQNAV
jgi:pilus assembly protein Flp/PilA